MKDLDEILRLNPRAAKGIDDIREVLEAIQKLRDAGVANRPELTNPGGSRKNLGDLKTQRRNIFKKTLYA